MNEEFDIKKVMERVQEKRKGFTLEGDFQFIFGLAIYEIYGNKVNIIMEYKYPDDALLKEDTRQYIDVLVIMNNKWYPIELKYKHKECNIHFFSESESTYTLGEQSCRKNHRVAYVEDIERLLKCRNTTIFDCKKNEQIQFGEGYAILLTNYQEFSTKEYKTYSLRNENGIKEIKNYKFDTDYDMKWLPYKTPGFSYLITTIKREK